MIRTRGLIDTGATITGISNRLVQELSLPRRGRIAITTPSGDHVARTYQFRLGFFVGDTSLPHVLAPELIGIDASPGSAFEVLIGMDVIGAGDLRVDRNGTGNFRFDSA